MDRRSWTGLLFLILQLSSGALANENLTAHFIDVGQGDSILLQFKEKNILIDGGIQEMGPRVEGYLRNQSVSRLDLVILTHPHDDHLGGLITILKDFPVREVLDNGQPHSSLVYKIFKTLITQKNISYNSIHSGQEIDIDKDLPIQILSPPPLDLLSDGFNSSIQSPSRVPWESFAVRMLSGSMNQNSIVLRITYDEISLLFMADADTVVENLLVNSGTNLSSDILKVGHHGGTSASSMDFLESVQPAVSIIQVGEGNYYGYPTQKTLDALQSIGSEIYRTDTCGNIIVTSDGLNYSITTKKIC